MRRVRQLYKVNFFINFRKGYNLAFKSRGSVDPFIVMDIMQKAKEAEIKGKSIIHMEVGQPSTGAPRSALNILSKEMVTDNFGYTESTGILSLKKRLSKLYKDRYRLNIDSERIIVTSGSSASFVLAFISLFESGQKVLIGEPGYPSYRNILQALDLVPVKVQTSFTNGFHLTGNDIKNTDVNGVLIASPANPTGSILDSEKLGDLVKSATARNIPVISDEIYHGLSYGKNVHSALEYSDSAYVVGSFSKYFAMTGWRAGWLVAPRDKIRRIERLAANLFICAPHASQRLAELALNHDKELKEKVNIYQRNRELLMESLPEIGFTKICPPDGAFYIYCDVSELAENSKKLCDNLFETTGIALTPGNDFDTKRGDKFVRFSYACSTSDVIEAIKRLKLWRKKY